MKFIFGLCLSVILMSMSFQGQAQGFVENALLFSRTKPGGSARIQAMGGAQIALGGDFSSALSNPAGLGMYNRSEFTFSAALNSYKTESKHLGTNSNDSKNVFNIPGLSYVHHMPAEKNGFLGGSFGGSMTRINDFNTTFQYEGLDDNSIVDYFLEIATGSSLNQLPSPYEDTPILPLDVPVDLAYRTFLINPINETDPYPDPFTPQDYFDYTNYFSDLDTLGNEIRTQNRNGKVNVSGAQYQWSFAYGGNYKDKLFFGASLGITTLRYKYSTTYEESDYSFSESPGYDPLNRLQLDEGIDIDGTGVNFTVGLIYRPVDFAQIGISFATPTYYELSDSYSTQLQADWNASAGYGYLEEFSEPIIAEYSLVTPLKFSTGAVFFLGKYGFITGDLEFINYNKAEYDSNTPGVSFSPENDDIDFYYSNVINYRFGAEFRYNIFRLRGGYNIQNNPYKEEFNVDRKIITYSAGAGVRFSKFFIDVAWLNSKSNDSYSPYVFQDGSGPVANLSSKTTSGMLTLGFNF